MDTLTFGVTLTVVGMGGTLLSLWVLGLVVTGLKKMFPLSQGGQPKEER